MKKALPKGDMASGRGGGGRRGGRDSDMGGRGGVNWGGRGGGNDWGMGGGGGGGNWGGRFFCLFSC